MTQKYSPDQIEQGTAWKNTTIQYVDQNDQPINLTGYSVALAIKDSNGAVKLTLTAGSGLTVTNSTGTIQPRLTNSQTESLGVGGYNYDLYLTDPSGDTIVILTGYLDIVKK